jgi:hypothetical protein
MRFQNYLEVQYLTEWKVHKQYAGRSLAEPGKTILWMYVTIPEFKGLIYTYPDGSTFLNDKRLGRTIKADDPKATHKRQLADFFNKLGLDKHLDPDDNKRSFIEDIYEQNVRGRIIGNDVYVYSSSYVGIEGKKYKKMVDKAIDYLYDYIDEDYGK